MAGDSGRHLAIIGGGPIGLELALAALNRGHQVTLIERSRIGENVRRWGHVRLFSPWMLNVSTLGLQTIEEAGIEPPDPQAFPTGAEYVERYLVPLSVAVRESGTVLENCTVLSTGRSTILKAEHVGNGQRSAAPFRILVDDNGHQRYIEADVVVDCSGTYGNPNHLGAGGLPAIGEEETGQRITWIIPDVLGEDREEYEGHATLVVGAGFSAITTLNLLLDLEGDASDTRIIWLTRRDEKPYGRVDDDPLPERDRLSELGNQLAGADPRVEYLGAHSVERLKPLNGDVEVTVADSKGEQRSFVVHRIVANVGYRPDANIHRELQVHQCYATEGPMKLAAELLADEGSGGDCLQQRSAGADALRNPEPDFYILGAKSYGRKSNFLIRLGLAQIDDLLSILS